MRTIWKYPIAIMGFQKLSMPGRFDIVHVGIDAESVPCIWSEVEPDKKLSYVDVYVFGTGHTLPLDPLKHIGSFVQSPFVWHVYIDVDQ